MVAVQVTVGRNLQALSLQVVAAALIWQGRTILAVVAAALSAAFTVQAILRKPPILGRLVWPDLLGAAYGAVVAFVLCHGYVIGSMMWYGGAVANYVCQVFMILFWLACVIEYERDI